MVLAELYYGIGASVAANTGHTIVRLPYIHVALTQATKGSQLPVAPE